MNVNSHIELLSYCYKWWGQIWEKRGRNEIVLLHPFLLYLPGDMIVAIVSSVEPPTPKKDFVAKLRLSHTINLI